MNRRLFCILLLMLLTSVPYGFGQSDNTNITLNAIDSIPFKLTSYNNIVVEVVLNKRDTLDIMLHTASNSVSVVREHSKKIQSIMWDDSIGVGSWGGNGNSRYSTGNRLQISQSTFEDIEVWENKNSGPGTQGKFGLDLFEDYVVEINFDNEIIFLYESLPSKIERYTSCPVIRKDNLLFVQGAMSIDGIIYEHDFLYHSGYAGALLIEDVFARKAQLAKRIKITSEQELKDSFGNPVTIKRGKIPFFFLAKTSFSDVNIGFFDGKIGQQRMSILGGDIIRRFNVILPKDRSVIYLSQVSSITN